MHEKSEILQLTESLVKKEKEKKGANKQTP